MINVILPEGSFGQNESEDAASDVLRLLTRILEKRGAETSKGILGGSDGYGAYFENDTFMMNPYCWCELESCPWCAPCTCPDSAHHYFVDGKEVTYQEWDDFYMTQVYGATKAKLGQNYWNLAYLKNPDLINKRRTTRHDPECRVCRGEFGHAPNFHHKPSGTKVWWYKYIGRSMEIEGHEDWVKILADCTASLANAPSP